MKILILNWKDIRNPRSGGAEILTHEVAKRLVVWGHEVTMFVSSFDQCQKKETIDGVTVIREGSANISRLQKSVYLKAYNFYRTQQGKVDVVIDEIHGIPFFTPLYIKEKKVALICEVAKDIWDKMFPFPLNLLGKFVERFYFFFYRRIPFMTISNSTKEDVVSMGIDEKQITVLPMGINRVQLKKVKKDYDPTILFVGRLNKMKGVDDALQAFYFLKKSIPTAKFWIVGRGEQVFVDSLKENVGKQDLRKDVIFWDFVSEQKKFELMARAHVIVVPSVREGFGLIVPEAGSVGTPAVVYDVPGLRDIVKNGINGVVVEKKHPKALGKGIAFVLEDEKRYKTFQEHAISESNVYNWDETAKVVLSVLRK